MNNENTIRPTEKILDRAFDDELRNSEKFVSWLLSKTKFAAKNGKYVWSRSDHPWCKMEVSLEGDIDAPRFIESETDILAVFVGDDGCRFALHFENKLGTGAFEKNQPELYAKRAKHWMKNPKYGDYSDFETVLIAPLSFHCRNAIEAARFDRFISHEEIANYIPFFAPRELDASTKS